MHYSIRHLTKFKYRSGVSESIMELMMHPRSDLSQRCLAFQVSVSPRCRVFSYRDHLANHVHHFDIPVQHEQLVIVAESLVEVLPLPEVPYSLGSGSWGELDRLVHADDFWEMLLPSEFACPTPALEELANHLDVRRKDDPLRVLHTLNQQMFDYFDYKPNSTRADSPIDVALTNKGGVCQDFAHIMTTLIRSRLQIPCRYVSGYLSPGPEGQGINDRSASSATHAWIEAFLPELGWVGFDPTNWLYANDRHIRTAIGRDYSDVPPTHGIFRGRAKSELTVAVSVTPSEDLPSLDLGMPVPEEWTILVEKAQAVSGPCPGATETASTSSAATIAGFLDHGRKEIGTPVGVPILSATCSLEVKLRCELRLTGGSGRGDLTKAGAGEARRGIVAIEGGRKR